MKYSVRRWRTELSSRVQTRRSSIYDVDGAFDNRMSLLIDPPDGKVPALTAEGRRRVATTAAARLRRDGPEDFHRFNTVLRGACLGQRRQSLRQATTISFKRRTTLSSTWKLTYAWCQSMVVVLPTGINGWLGDSHARWDGETFVIDTTNFHERSDCRGSSDHLHLIEKLRRESARVLDYQITIDDPTVWVSPWTLGFGWRQRASGSTSMCVTRATSRRCWGCSQPHERMRRAQRASAIRDRP